MAALSRDLLGMPEFQQQVDAYTEQLLTNLARVDALAMCAAFEAGTDASFRAFSTERLDRVRQLSPMANRFVDLYESYEDCLFL